MGVLTEFIRALIAGIVLLFAYRHASQIATRGEFVSMFTFLLLDLFLMYVLKEELFRADKPFSRRFEGLSWMINTTLGSTSTYLIYVLVQALRNWTDTRFLDRPFAIVQLATVMCIMIVLYALMYVVQRYAEPKDSDVHDVTACARDLCRLRENVPPRGHSYEL